MRMRTKDDRAEQHVPPERKDYRETDAVHLGPQQQNAVAKLGRGCQWLLDLAR